MLILITLLLIMEIIVLISLILLIIILSGLVSGTEAALLSVSLPKIKSILNEDKKNNSLKRLIYIKENIQDYITTIVILNNIINIVGSIYVGHIASKIFGDIYLGIFSGILTFLIIIFAEIIPKIYGEKYSLFISKKIATLLYFTHKIFKPIVYLTKKIVDIFIIKDKNTSKQISEGEIKEMAAIGEKEGSINAFESYVINNVFKFDDVEIYDIMIPKNEVIYFSEDATYEEIIKVAQKTGFTRFPIFSKKDKEEIIGIINIKDLFKYHKKENKFSISKILRPIFYVPENMKVFQVQERFKKERTHMAIVVNEYGDFVGIITLEDVIEVLLGEIEDEFDKDEILIKKIGDKRYIIKASCDIKDIDEELKMNLSNKENDYTTLNGYLLYKLEKIPKVNDVLKEKNFTMRVVKATKKKVLEVELILKD